MASPSGGDQVGVALEQLNAHLLRLGYELPHSMAAEVRALPPIQSCQHGACAPLLRVSSVVPHALERTASVVK